MDVEGSIELVATSQVEAAPIRSRRGVVRTLFPDFGRAIIPAVQTITVESNNPIPYAGEGQFVYGYDGTNSRYLSLYTSNSTIFNRVITYKNLGTGPNPSNTISYDASLFIPERGHVLIDPYNGTNDKKATDYIPEADPDNDFSWTSYWSNQVVVSVRGRAAFPEDQNLDFCFAVNFRLLSQDSDPGVEHIYRKPIIFHQRGVSYGSYYPEYHINNPADENEGYTRLTYDTESGKFELTHKKSQALYEPAFSVFETADPVNLSNNFNSLTFSRVSNRLILRVNGVELANVDASDIHFAIPTSAVGSQTMHVFARTSGLFKRLGSWMGDSSSPLDIESIENYISYVPEGQSTQTASAELSLTASLFGIGDIHGECNLNATSVVDASSGVTYSGSTIFGVKAVVESGGMRLDVGQFVLHPDKLQFYFDATNQKDIVYQEWYPDQVYNWLDIGPKGRNSGPMDRWEGTFTIPNRGIAHLNYQPLDWGNDNMIPMRTFLPRYDDFCFATYIRLQDIYEDDWVPITDSHVIFSQKFLNGAMPPEARLTYHVKTGTFAFRCIEEDGQPFHIGDLFTFKKSVVLSDDFHSLVFRRVGDDFILTVDKEVVAHGNHQNISIPRGGAYEEDPRYMDPQWDSDDPNDWYWVPEDTGLFIRSYGEFRRVMLWNGTFTDDIPESPAYVPGSEDLNDVLAFTSFVPEEQNLMTLGGSHLAQTSSMEITLDEEGGVEMGDIVLSTSAELDADGFVVAMGDVILSTSAELDADGSVVAMGDIVLSTSAELDVDGYVVAMGDIVLSTSAELDVDGSVVAMGDIVLSTSAELDVDGSVVAMGDVVLSTSAELDVDGNVVPATPIGGGSGGWRPVSVMSTGINNGYNNVNIENPLNRNHKLSKGLIGCWIAMPQINGTTRLMDLTGEHNAKFGNSSVGWGVTTKGPTINFTGTGTGFAYIQNKDGTNSTSAFNFSKNDAFTVLVCSIRGEGLENRWVVGKQGTSGAFPGWGLTSGAEVSKGFNFGLQLRTNDSTSSRAEKVSTSNKFSDNNWHSFLASYDGSTDANGITLYEDGVIAPSEITANVLGPSDITNTAFAGFGSRNATNAGVTMKIQTIMIWDRELSADEVKEVHQQWTSDYPDLLNRTSYSWIGGSSDEPIEENECDIEVSSDVDASGFVIKNASSVSSSSADMDASASIIKTSSISFDSSSEIVVNFDADPIIEGFVDISVTSNIDSYGIKSIVDFGGIDLLGIGLVSCDGDIVSNEPQTHTASVDIYAQSGLYLSFSNKLRVIRISSEDAEKYNALPEVRSIGRKTFHPVVMHFKHRCRRRPRRD